MLLIRMNTVPWRTCG